MSVNMYDYLVKAYAIEGSYTTVAYRPQFCTYAVAPGVAGYGPIPQPEPVKRVKSCLYCRSGYDYEIQRCPSCGAPEYE
jgi:hypothetical protein